MAEFAPKNPILQSALAHISQRNWSQGEDLCRQVLASQPGNVEALIVLARVLRLMGGQREAADRCAQAVDAEPENAEGHFLLGVCLIDLWRIPEAINALQKTISLDPSHGMAYDRLGHALYLRNRPEEAIAAMQRAVELRPETPNSWAILGKLLERKGDTKEAESAYTRALRAAAKGAQQMVALGWTHQSIGNLERAESAFRSAITMAPNALEPNTLLCQVLAENGKFDEAKTELEKCIKRYPEESTFYIELIDSKRVTSEDLPLLGIIRHLLKRSTLSPKDRSQFNYALGKALDDLKQYEEAMTCFREANRVAHLSIPESPDERAEHSALIDLMISTFTADYFAKNAGHGLDSEAPVFIIGMPRSGTTLLEQRLSCHPQVAAGGELLYLSSRALELVNPAEAPIAENIAELAEGYLRLIGSASSGEMRVTDKLPHNFMLVGIIHLIFPRARIIYCRRNPIDTCLSIFVTPIDVGFSRSFSDLAYSLRESQRICEHWKSVLPPHLFTEIDYEKHVSEPESEARRIVEFMGLDWDDAVLNHATSPRTVTTASKWQVRQPLHSGSVERWRRYAPWIPDLIGEFPDFVDSSAPEPRQ